MQQPQQIVITYAGLISVLDMGQRKQFPLPFLFLLEFSDIPKYNSNQPQKAWPTAMDLGSFSSAPSEGLEVLHT